MSHSAALSGVRLQILVLTNQLRRARKDRRHSSGNRPAPLIERTYPQAKVMRSDESLRLHHRLEFPHSLLSNKGRLIGLLGPIVGIFSTKLDTPRTDSLVTDGDSPLSQEIFNISVAWIEAIIEPNGTTDYVWWKSATFVCIHGQT
jgi:hypothetical protein